MSDLDLSTAETTRKALHDINSRQKELGARNESLSEQVEKKTADLAAVSKRLAEIENAEKHRTSNDGNAALGRYVREDGTVRMAGESTETTAYMPGLLDDAPRSDWHGDFQRAVDDHNMMKLIRKGKPVTKSENRVVEIGRRSPIPEVRRIFADGAGSGSGADWIPDVMLPVLERDLTMARRVVANFQTWNMTSKNEILPTLSLGFRPYVKSAATADDPSQYTASSLTTAQRAITATGFAVRSQVDADSSQDTLLNSLDLIRSELVSAIVDGEEDSCINGDDAASHQDAIASWNSRGRWGSASSSADHRTAWQGLRARAYDVSNTVDQGSTETFAGLMSTRGTLDSPHGVDGDLCVIVSPERYLDVLVTMAEVKSLSDFGPNYTALSGQVAAIGGMPVIVSEFVTADLAATGLYTGSGATSGWLIVNRSRFRMGRLGGGAQVQLAPDITRGIYDVVATSRQVFFTIDGTSKKNVAWGYNMDGS